MPDLNGLEFLESAASTLKKVKSVIMSGDTSAIENIPQHYKIIDKGDPEFFKKLLTLIKTIKIKQCNVAPPAGNKPVELKKKSTKKKNSPRIKTVSG
jgi:hypothetical protein